jgi:glycosyltransferase involved in cell wall biosynthesis
LSALTLTYSIADQNFQQTKSIGILNLSVQFVPYLASRSEIGRMDVLSNQSLVDRLKAPPNVPVHLHNLALRGKAGRILWDQWGVYRAARRLGNRWLYMPKGFAPFTGRCPVKLVTCVADANHDYYAEHYPGVVPKFEMWYFQQSVRGTIRYSDLIVTISEYTAAEIVRLAKKYGIPAPPVQSIGIGFTRPPAIAVQKQDRILVFAGRWPHKRTDLALQFLERWQRQTNYPGAIEWVGKLPDGLGLPSFPGWRLQPRLPEAEFRKRIAEARTVVYFSDYEGFGMPPVEAIIAGTNAVYSDLPATREVMQNAGHGFANAAYESFDSAMNQALKTSPDALARWAADLLARHRWETVADRAVRAILTVDQESSSRRHA